MAKSRSDDQVPAKQKKVRVQCGACGGTITPGVPCKICAQRELRRKRNELTEKKKRQAETHARQRARQVIG